MGLVAASLGVLAGACGGDGLDSAPSDSVGAEVAVVAARRPGKSHGSGPRRGHEPDPERWYPKGADGRVQKFNDLPPEYQGNVNTQEVPYERQPGDAPRLAGREIDDLLQFLETLSDGDERDR